MLFQGHCYNRGAPCSASSMKGIIIKQLQTPSGQLMKKICTVQTAKIFVFLKKKKTNRGKHLYTSTLSSNITLTLEIRD